MTWDKFGGFAVLGAFLLLAALYLLWIKKKGSSTHYRRLASTLVLLTIASAILFILNLIKLALSK